MITKKMRMAQILQFDEEESNYARVLSFGCFICFIFYQFGPSYHLSFGSIGVVLIMCLLWPKITAQDFLLALAGFLLIWLSYLIFIFFQSDSDTLLRMGRFSLNAFLLLVLFRAKNIIPTPSSKVIYIAIVGLLGYVGYQNFIDPSLRTPYSWFALSAEPDYFDYSNYVERVSLRASGPYSEPSVLGLVFCCLFSFSIRMKGVLKAISSVFCFLGVLLSGSLLGLIGISLLVLCALANGNLNIRVGIIFIASSFLLVVNLLFFSGYELAFLNRVYESSSLIDVSTQVRIINPFLLIFEIASDFYIFGYPGNVFLRYLGMGLYDSFGNFPGHNGFLSLVMAFGVVGIWLIWVLIRQVSTIEEFILLILIGSQSGNFLSYEKVFLMIYIICSVRSNNRCRTDAAVQSCKRNV